MDHEVHVVEHDPFAAGEAFAQAVPGRQRHFNGFGDGLGLPRVGPLADQKIIRNRIEGPHIKHDGAGSQFGLGGMQGMMKLMTYGAVRRRTLFAGHDIQPT